MNGDRDRIAEILEAQREMLRETRAVREILRDCTAAIAEGARMTAGYTTEVAKYVALLGEINAKLDAELRRGRRWPWSR